MLLPRPLVLLILLPFAAYSTYAIAQVGYLAIFTSHFHTAGFQVLADLVIACLLAMVWMWRDAAASGRNVWPFLLLTLGAGSIGPLQHARDNLAKWMRPEKRKPTPAILGLFGAKAEVRFQPKGVVGVISPWNFPVNLTFAPLAGILAAGNRAMIKPSEFTPATSELMQTMFSGAFSEEEIAQLDPDEQAMFLSEMGLKEAGLDRLIRAGYGLLHLQTYFTVGPKEARAWTIARGTLAPAAAGVIHGDFEKGFIRAETVGYDDYIAGNGETGAKEAGKFRVEGKTYEVKDGDVLHFLFSG